MVLSPCGGRHKSMMLTFISICLLRCCMTTWTHWQPSPPMCGWLPCCWRHRQWWTGWDFSPTQLCWWYLILRLPSRFALSMWTGPLPWSLHWMLCKPSQNQIINIMQRDLHPPHPFYSQFSLGTLTLNFHHIILNNTSSHWQNCTWYPCWAHYWFQTSWLTSWVCYLCLIVKKISLHYLTI